ncbi:hypothetical protein L0F63_006508 [Massospora cicadina]|nr:hypothetical protein L0F63_006508 [Massospora cicadina]
MSLIKGTSCSNKKGWRVALKPKIKKKSKNTNLKGLYHSDSASKPAAVKPESPSHAKAKKGSPLQAKPHSLSNSTLKPKSKLIQDDSNNSEDQFKGSIIKPTLKSVVKVLALDKPESKPKTAPKRKNLKENFEVEAILFTIAKAHTHRQAIPKASYGNTIVLSSEERNP